jgi:DNA-binding IclR family transcriptional regulator
MPVKRSQSASRVLAVLETIARHQPVGVSTLSRELAADKSAVQRAIMTLADTGWIHPAGGAPTRWQLTARILAVAHTGHRSNDLRQRARSTLEALRDESEETVLLTVQDMLGFVVIEAIESRQMLRTVPHIGMAVPVRGSATSRAMLPYMTEERQAQLLGKPPDAALLNEFATTRKRGYSVSEGGVVAGSTTIAAPILEVDGRPSAAIVISAPSGRMSVSNQRRIGVMVCRAARKLSRDGRRATASGHLPFPSEI